MYETLDLSGGEGAVLFVVRNPSEVAGYGLHVSTDTYPNANPPGKGPSTRPEFALWSGTVQKPHHDLVFWCWQGRSIYRVDLGQKSLITYVSVLLSRNLLRVEAIKLRNPSQLYSVSTSLPLLDEGQVNDFWFKQLLYYTENGVISGQKSRNGKNYQLAYVEAFALPG